MREFAERLMGLLKEHLGDDISIHLEKVRKNNGVCRIGICMREKENCAEPILYLEPFYQGYLKGVAMEEIADEICEWYKSQRLYAAKRCEWGNLFSPERVVCKLVNREANREMLKEVPYKPFLDLAVVFGILVENEREGYGMVTLNRAINERIRLSVEELYPLALSNMKQLMPFSCRDIYEVLFDGRENSRLEVSEDFPLYVLTNHANLYGAAEILCDGVLEEIADRLGYDLILLPSSVHEFLVLPDNGTFEAEKLKGLVKEVNRAVVSEEEWLSDNVYVFRRETGRTSILGGTENKGKAEH